MATTVLRVRLRSVLQQDPDNRRVLREAAMLLAQLYSARYGLERSDGNYLKKVVRALLEQHLEPGSPNKRPLQNESDIP
ncbi:MAG: hypothetical protein HYX95_00480 [Chloroflexi bacterium]|nr:hypothetical protein [Chloroflexota bacterium]